MREIACLSVAKRAVPDVVASQLRNVNVFNFGWAEHFPDEASCISFSQAFGLCPNRQSQIQHCKGDFCRVVDDKTRKLGFKYRCYNKTRRSKERCRATVSPLQNTFFESCHITIHDVFKLVMSFVSEFSVRHTVRQL